MPDAALRHHRVCSVPMSEKLSGLARVMDALVDDGWEPFHVHEATADGEPVFIVFSRRKAA